MYDYCVRFDTLPTLEATLFGDGKPLFDAVDVIGTIYKNTGTPEEPIMTAQPGFHANVRHSEEVPALGPFTVYPVTPARVWA